MLTRHLVLGAVLIATLGLFLPFAAKNTSAFGAPTTGQSVECGNEIGDTSGSDTSGVNDNPIIADPSMVRATGCNTVLTTTTVHAAIDVHEKPPAVATPIIAPDDIGDAGMAAVTPILTGVDATIPVNPNDDPRIDDPSKIEGDDYIGEMIVVLPSQDTNPMVALDGNALDADQTSTSVQEDDFIGEMVVISSDRSVGQEEEISAIDIIQYIGVTFLPFVNN